jgi:hypothetical protein
MKSYYYHGSNHKDHETKFRASLSLGLGSKFEPRTQRQMNSIRGDTWMAREYGPNFINFMAHRAKSGLRRLTVSVYRCGRPILYVLGSPPDGINIYADNVSIMTVPMREV